MSNATDTDRRRSVWQQIEQENDLRADRATMALGASHLAVALVGTVIALLSGHVAALGYVALYFVGGGALITAWYLKRRRDQRAKVATKDS